MCHSRCAMAGVSFSMLSLGRFVCQTHVQTSAEYAEPAETPWRTYDGTPIGWSIALTPRALRASEGVRRVVSAVAAPRPSPFTGAHSVVNICHRDF